jgi:hypothetical protein
MSNPTHATYVASVLDPAFNTSTTEGRAALDVYASTRELADLAKIPLAGGDRPTLWKVKALTAEQRAIVLSNTFAGMRALDATRFAVIARLEGATVGANGIEGGKETALETSGEKSPMLTEKALAAEVEIAGGAWVDEIGSVVIHRANLHPRRFRPFTLPPLVAAFL